MLLILGLPGIGKSTLITWITAHFKNFIDNILPESVKLSCFLQELLRIDVIHCFASNSSTQFLFVA